MAKKKTGWRPAFLRALARSGNVTLSARAAGVDKTTAYSARRADEGFGAKWEKAIEKGKRRPSPRSPGSSPGESPSPASGRGELVVRKSKRCGAQLVKAAVGRWSTKSERVFLAALMRTGCVRSAACACGLSTNALYHRKKKYPDFAARWRAAEAEAGERVPALLTAAAIGALDPEIDAADLPPVSVSEALHICRMKGFGGNARAAPEEPIEQVRARVLAQLDAIEAAEGENASPSPLAGEGGERGRG